MLYILAVKSIYGGLAFQVLPGASLLFLARPNMARFKPVSFTDFLLTKAVMAMYDW